MAISFTICLQLHKIIATFKYLEEIPKNKIKTKKNKKTLNIINKIKGYYFLNGIRTKNLLPENCHSKGKKVVCSKAAFFSSARKPLCSLWFYNINKTFWHLIATFSDSADDIRDFAKRGKWQCMPHLEIIFCLKTNFNIKPFAKIICKKNIYFQYFLLIKFLRKLV